MNRISEFQTLTFGSNGGTDITTWRWMPEDHRAQRLYADDALPAELMDEYRTLAESSQVWIVDEADVYFEYSDGARPATTDEKMEILDGWVWLSRTSVGARVLATPDSESLDYWSGHRHPLVDGVSQVSPEEHAELVVEPAAVELTDEMIATFEAVQQAWDAKRDRYVKLGWTEEDVVAEFGSRPETGL